MGWFENQIEERRNADEQLLEDSFVKIAGVVLGQRTAQKIGDERIVTKSAIDEILKYYHCKPTEIPEDVKAAEEQLDFSLRPHGLMRRNVELTEGWYKDAYGPILAFTKEDGLPVALLPGQIRGYHFTNPKTRKKERVNTETAALFDTGAICFYRPLPQKSLRIPDLLLFMKRCVSYGDIIVIACATLAVTMVGLIMPRITRALTGPVLSSGRANALIGIAICMICVSLSSQLISSVKNLVQERLNTKTSLGVQAAMMMRLMSLPAAFFRKYSPGELKSRAGSVGQLCSMLMSMVMSTTLTSLTSLLYIGQIFRFAPALVIPSLVIVLVTVVFSVVSTLTQIRINRMQMQFAAKESGMSYSLITGVQKIKLSGAEKRVFAKWLDMYAEENTMSENMKRFLDDMKENKEMKEKYEALLVGFLAENKALSETEAIVKAASALGYDVTAAQIERYIADREEVDVDALDRVAGGAETDDCTVSYSCNMAFLHPDTGEKNKACFADYYCNAIYHKNPDIKACE